MAWSLFLGTLAAQPSDENISPEVAMDHLKRAIVEVSEGRRVVHLYNNGDLFIEVGEEVSSGYWLQFLPGGRLEIGEPAA